MTGQGRRTKPWALAVVAAWGATGFVWHVASAMLNDMSRKPESAGDWYDLGETLSAGLRKLRSRCDHLGRAGHLTGSLPGVHMRWGLARHRQAIDVHAIA